MPSLTVHYPYTGSKDCSVNHCYLTTPTGKRVLRKVARQWRDGLAMAIKNELDRRAYRYARAPIRVSVYGYFKDFRSSPDMHNLAKQIMDAAELATGIDDRDMTYHSGGFKVGFLLPELEITLEWDSGDAEPATVALSEYCYGCEYAVNGKCDRPMAICPRSAATAAPVRM